MVEKTLEQLRRAFPNGQLGDGWYKLDTCPECGTVGKCAVSVHGNNIGGASCFHKPNGQDHNSEATAKVYAAIDSNTPWKPSAAPAPTANSGWGYSEAQLRRAEANIEKAATFLAERGISMEWAKRKRFGVEDDRIVMPSFYEGELVSVKMRQLVVLSKATKWKKHNRDKGTHILFNRETLSDGGWGVPLYFIESQLDCAMLESRGKRAVSVEDAGHKLCEADIAALREWVGPIIFVPDNEASRKGTSCMLGIAEALGIADEAECINVPIQPGESKSDLGQLYARDPENFDAALDALPLVPLWRSTFKSVGELEQGEPRQLITGGMVMEGINLNAAPSGVCKTWVQLAMSKALISGNPLFGFAPFAVPERQHVIYLIPEASEKSFRRRCEKMGIELGGEYFLCRTMKQGVLKLDDPALLAAIRKWQPVVFLDTYIRFMPQGTDENSSGDNARGLAEQTFNIIRLGAGAVVAAHHSPKSITQANDKGRYVTREMTLENMVRGTGDIGAMLDNAIGYRHADSDSCPEYLKESHGLTRVVVQNLKDREGITGPEEFIIQGRPHIDTVGDFRVLTEEELPADLPERLAGILEKGDPAEVRKSKSALAKAAGVGRTHMPEPKGWYWREKGKTTGEYVKGRRPEPGEMGFEG
jgi:hypothetical protein